MRDLIVSFVVLSTLPYCYRRPIIGVMMFSLLAYMRLQDLAWGFARYQRWSYFVALVMFAGYFSDPNRRGIKLGVRPVLLMTLLAWVIVGSWFGKGESQFHFASSTEYAKIVGFALFTTAVVYTRDHLRIMMWVIAMSFAFYGVKSGVMGVLSLGRARIIQGPGGMLYDNNDFALAIAMSVPVLLNLALAERRPILRRWVLMMVPLAYITIMMTHSRGAFLSASFGTFILVWRSRNRISGILIGIFLAMAALVFAPTEYKERITSIGNYEEDGSAQGRFQAWGVAVNMIKAEPLFGVGFGRFKSNYYKYSGSNRKEGAKVTHNSYLQIWAECGTPAFLLYVSLMWLSIFDVWKVRSMAKRRYAQSWILYYCTMFEAAIFTFMLGSMFLNRAHFDLIYHYFMIVMIFGNIAREEMNALDRGESSQPSGGGIRFGRLTRLRSRGFGRNPQVASGFRTT